MIQHQLVNDRLQMPEGMLTLLLRLQRSGAKRDVFIWLLDQLAPSYAVRGMLRVFGSSSIAEDAKTILTLFPPADTPEAAVWTMAPDAQDHGELPPERINAQWKPLLQTYPDWRNALFLPWDRTEMYRRMGEFPGWRMSINLKDGTPEMPVDIFVITRDRTPYGNLVLNINPSESAVLKSLPNYLPPKLLDIMSHSGHSERVVVLPGNSPLLTEECVSLHRDRGRVFSIDSANTAVTVAGITDLWLPDTHRAADWDPVRNAMGVWSPTGAMFSEHRLRSTVTNPAWLSRMEGFQTLSAQEMVKVLEGHRTVAVLITSFEDKDPWADFHAVIVNGISGHIQGI